MESKTQTVEEFIAAGGEIKKYDVKPDYSSKRHKWKTQTEQPVIF